MPQKFVHTCKEQEMKNWLMPIATILLTLSILPTPLWGDTAKIDTSIIPELRAHRINPAPPRIDGRLDDAIWSNPAVEKGKMFIQRAPLEGTPVSESTLVAAAYDDQALYVAFWCYDSEPDKISRQLVRRDRTSQADHVTLRIDPFHDHQSGYAFEVNASGVQRDCRYFDENSSDMDWDAVWESGASVLRHNCLDI